MINLKITANSCQQRLLIIICHVNLLINSPLLWTYGVAMSLYNISKDYSHSQTHTYQYPLLVPFSEESNWRILLVRTTEWKANKRDKHNDRYTHLHMYIQWILVNLPPLYPPNLLIHCNFPVPILISTNENTVNLLLFTVYYHQHMRRHKVRRANSDHRMIQNTSNN